MAQLLAGYWQSDFDIKRDDLDRRVEDIRQNQRACTLTELARRIVRGRLIWGDSLGESVLPQAAGHPDIRLWDPACSWQVGEWVIVPRSVDEEDIFIPFAGQIVKIDSENGHHDIRLDQQEELVTFKSAEPGSKNALIWRQTAEESVRRQREKLEGSKSGDDMQVNLVLMEHGEKIFSRLKDALENDPRFVQHENRWFLKELLTPFPDESLQQLRQAMLANNQPRSLEEILAFLPDLQAEDAVIFSLVQAMKQSPEHFQTQDGKWFAVKPPPPLWQQAVGAYYVYDPQTYRILLQPGQRLKKDQAERLEDLGWYAEVVQPAE